MQSPYQFRATSRSSLEPHLLRLSLADPENHLPKAQNSSSPPYGMRLDDGSTDKVLQPKRILVVDDNQASRDLLRSALETDDYLIDEASDGREALDSIRKKKPDLVLMDIQMPIMDGYTALHEIRETIHDLPVIAITAYVLLDDGRRARSAGFDGYLAKPVNVSRLRSEVARFLSQEKG